MQYSLKTEQGQTESSKTEPYASRLREERLRIEPHQGKFAAKIGVTRNRQSFLENGERELRAEYLDLILNEGLDVLYILTGRRSASLLAVDESRVLDSFRALDQVGRDALLAILTRMSGRAPSHDLDEPASTRPHDPKQTYHPPPSDWPRFPNWCKVTPVSRGHA